MPVSKADALAGEEGVVWPWVSSLSGKMLSKGWLEAPAAAALLQRLPMSETDAVSWGSEAVAGNLISIVGITCISSSFSALVFSCGFLLVGTVLPMKTGLVKALRLLGCRKKA
jgi:hypothetical protein